MFNSAFGGQNYKANDKVQDLEVFLDCTFEELYNGCIKKLVYERNKLNSDNRTTYVCREELDIEVYKGYDKNTVLDYPGLGHQAPGQKPCNYY
jgi:DnaJ-class molecular chaperone